MHIKVRIVLTGLFLLVFLGSCIKDLAPDPSEEPTIETPSFTVRIESTGTVSPSPTLSRFEETVSALVMTITPYFSLCAPSPEGDWRVSPNGEWITHTCQRDTSYGPYFYLMANNMLDDRTWSVELVYPGFYEYRHYPVHWSQDGKFLYVAVFFGGESGETFYPDGDVLARLNLLDGETDLVLSNHSGYYFAFSSGDMLAYSYQEFWGDPIDIYILDLRTWDSSQVRLAEYCTVGEMLWSPDEDRLILQAATCLEQAPELDRFDFVLVDLTTGSRTSYATTAEHRSDLPQALDWTDDFPRYIDRDYTYMGQDACWAFDLSSGELQATACP